jgi:hypothetical protein
MPIVPALITSTWKLLDSSRALTFSHSLLDRPTVHAVPSLGGSVEQHSTKNPHARAGCDSFKTLTSFTMKSCALARIPTFMVLVFCILSNRRRECITKWLFFSYPRRSRENYPSFQRATGNVPVRPQHLIRGFGGRESGKMKRSHAFRKLPVPGQTIAPMTAVRNRQQVACPNDKTSIVAIRK